MNLDILRSIMLDLSYKETIALCSTYKLGQLACTNAFWKDKIQHHFNIDVKSTNYKLEYKKLEDIYIMIKKLLKILKSLINERNKFQFLTMKSDFYDDIYEIYFNVDKDNHYELSYVSDRYLKEEWIEEAALIKVLIHLFYNYDMEVTQGIVESPILYNDLLNWETTIYKDLKEKLLKMWR